MANEFPGSGTVALDPAPAAGDGAAAAAGVTGVLGCCSDALSRPLDFRSTAGVLDPELGAPVGRDPEMRSSSLVMGVEVLRADGGGRVTVPVSMAPSMSVRRWACRCFAQ